MIFFYMTMCLIIVAILLVAELVCFKIADKYNIIDKLKVTRGYVIRLRSEG